MILSGKWSKWKSETVERKIVKKLKPYFLDKTFIARDEGSAKLLNSIVYSDKDNLVNDINIHDRLSRERWALNRECSERVVYGIFYIS